MPRRRFAAMARRPPPRSASSSPPGSSVCSSLDRPAPIGAPPPMPRRIACAMLIAFAGVGSPLAAQLPKTFHASLQSVDPKQGTITIKRTGTDKKESPQKLNLLREDLPVTDALDRPLKLTELRPF